MNTPKHTNELINENSPYLLQHAHNPVNWHAWNKSSLTLAKNQNKLLLISIGYSTCHWCHVMEKECFENEAVAQVMNAHYINIKIDREERPDLDHIYMNALQLMTRSGGWPLNIVALPDGRPVWGGTYFPKENWIEALLQIEKIFKQQPEKLEEYASRLHQGIKTMDLIKHNPEPFDFKKFDFENSLSFLKQQWDEELGGTRKAPKFMMPNYYHFLLRYGWQAQDESVKNHVKLTLTQMAYGGIFDHINGGFSRYSVDERWHIPHFEKMLYDNAQLVSLYCDAYLVFKKELFKEIVFDTLAFIKRELTDASGGFYSALDADSINLYGVLEEGAYYVFTQKELKEILLNDFELFAKYYNINNYGKWEKDHYVLIKNTSDKAFCKEIKISEKELKQKKTRWKSLLQNHRKNKQRPRLDYKMLTSWNAMMLKAYCDAYRVFKKKDFLEAALKSAEFISTKLIRKNGDLYRSYSKEKPSGTGFLEDYAFVIQAYIALYEITFDEKWIVKIEELTTATFQNFYDESVNMFSFTSKNTEKLISKTIEIRDNVMPSSNSVMAKNLFWIGTFFNNQKYLTTSQQMLKNVLQEIENYPMGYFNWMDLLLNYSNPHYEVAITGRDTLQKLNEFHQHYTPNSLFCGSIKESNYPLLKNRFEERKTLIYICTEGTCQLPTTKVLTAIKPLMLK